MNFFLEELYRGNSFLSHLLALGSEIFLLVALFICLFSLLFRKTKQTKQTKQTGQTKLQESFFFAQLFLILCSFSFSLWLFMSLNDDLSLFFFKNNFLLDPFALLVKSLVSLILFFLIIVSRNYFQTKKSQTTEVQAFLISGTLGACLICSCYDLIGLFVALELLSISNLGLVSLFDLRAISSKNNSSKFLGRLFNREACLKYLVNGALASAFLLFSFSLLFLISQGETNLAQIKLLSKLAAQDTLNKQFLLLFLPLFCLALVLILGSIAFKLSLVPFHLWAPDVYQGASLPASAFLSTISKIAGLSAFLRIFWNLFEIQIPGLQEFFNWWRPLAFILVCFSIIVASLVGLKQCFAQRVSLKRILAYSSISQVAYLLGALITERAFFGLSAPVVAEISGLKQALFYLLIYSLVNLAVFIAAIVWEKAAQENIDKQAYLHSSLPEKDTSEVHLDYYQGLFHLKPKLSIFFGFCFASLAGVLPIILIPKFLLLAALFKSGSLALLKETPQLSAGLLMGLLVLWGSLVSIYFYFLPIKKIFLEKPFLEIKKKILIPTSSKLVLYSLSFLFVLITLFPGVLLDQFSKKAAFSALNSSETLASQTSKQVLFKQILEKLRNKP